jgi:hypothetical protein
MPRKRTVEVIKTRTPSAAAFIAAVIAVGAVVVFAAVIVGRSDSGPINVAETINLSNVQSGSATGGTQPSAASQVFQSMPNGGLVPREQQDAPAPEPVPAEPAAPTSTPSAADGREGAPVEVGDAAGAEAPSDVPAEGEATESE